MITKKFFTLITLAIIILSTTPIIPITAQQDVYIVSNNIDVVAKPILEDYFRGYGLFPTFLTPDDMGQISGAKLLIILGGPDAPFGTGALVNRYLDSLEVSFIRQPGQRFTFIKPEIYGYADMVIIIAGADREKTYEEIFSLINGSNVSFENEVQKVAEGRVAIKDLPLVLASISYSTGTIDNIGEINLRLQNYGKGRATNVVVEISRDYYDNFTLQSVEPEMTVEGNKFYVGTIEGGQAIDLKITLKAKQGGIYSGTISYTHEAIETYAKIKDLTTRVP